MQRWISLAALTLALSACGGGGGGYDGDGGGQVPPPGPGPGPSGVGTLRVGLTDAPSCGFEKVYVTVRKVRVHQSASAGDNDAGWYDISLANAARIDLLSLSNGTLVTLGQTELPAGRYQQLRLVLDDGANANAVVPIGGAEALLETPSALQSGLKMNADFEVASDKIADVAIDFDACRSVLKLGNSGRYQLKPVLSLIPLFSDAGMRVTGYLDAGLGGGKATVSLQLNGVPVRATPTDADGRFTLYPVPTGTYDLVIRADGRATAVMTGVPVTATAITTLGNPNLRIMPPDTLLQATLGGKVSVDGATMNTGAEARLTQTLSGGPTVELGQMPVDAITGNYSFKVPLAMPVQMAYSANASSFMFAGQTADAGKVRIAISAPGQTSKSADLTLIGDFLMDFTFP